MCSNPAQFLNFEAIAQLRFELIGHKLKLFRQGDVQKDIDIELSAHARNCGIWLTRVFAVISS